MDITEFRDENLARLELSFVQCQDLLSVENFDDQTDREGFHVIPSSGDGVIGRYRSLRDMENDAPNILVRKSVYKKLCDADRALKQKAGFKNCQIIVTYGYRSPAIQQKLWDETYAEKKAENADASEEELREKTHRVIAYPSVAGHPTGGAVDVIIFDYKKGKFLDFGTDICDFKTKNVYYASDSISTTAKKNRKALRAVMCEQGFVPYDGEWWHFSYGDKEWAFYTFRRKKRNEHVDIEKTALYRQKEMAEISEIAYSDKFKLKSAEAQADEQVRVRLAVQKDGRLTEETLSILRRSGIEITQDKRGFLAKSGNFPLEVLFVRDDDISNLVDAGVADLGIVGENVFWENASRSIIKKHLGFGKCFLALAVPKGADIQTLQDLQGKRIATSYRRLTSQFLKEREITGVKIIDIAGSVEVAPLIDYADAIVDLVSTGSSLRQNNLEVFYNILNSQSILIANRAAEKDATKRQIIDRLIERIDSYLIARKYKRVTMDVPKEQCDKICAVLTDVSGLKAEEMEQMREAKRPLVLGVPVVLPTAGFAGWVSVQVVMEMSALWDKTTQLKQYGATNIVFYDIEGIVK
jgi:ATP phosphoribosyltransferase